MNKRTLTLCGLIVSLSLLPTVQAESDLDAIEATIFDYFNGLRLADREALERAFAVEHAHMKGYLINDAGELNTSSMPMQEVIDKWVARGPNLELKGRIVSINHYSEVAAQALFDFDGRYVDAFQLAKIDDHWRIVNKFYINK